MYIEYIETNEKSEVKRRAVAKEAVLTKDCTYCGKPSLPLWIGPHRRTTQLAVKWISSGNDIACSKSCVSSLNNQKMPKESYFRRGEKSRQTQKGRTFEEIYGEDKASVMKKEISERLKEHNPRWSTKYRTSDEIEMQKELNRNTRNNPFSGSSKGKTYEDIYGKEKAASIKAKLSEKLKGENNPMFGRPSPLSSGAG